MNFNELKSVEILDYEKYFTIHWKMTRWCNYNCSYCIQHHNYESNRIKYDYKKFSTYAKKINKWMKSVNIPMKLHLIGGEICYMDLIKVLEYIDAENFNKLSIVTNFSGSLIFFTDLRDYCQSRNIELQICASLHDQYVKVKDFVEKAKELKDCIHIQFTVTDTNTDNFVELVDLCTKYDLQYKTEGDKKGKRPLQKYDTCSADFPIKAKVKYKTGDETIMPIPEFRHQIIFNPKQRIRCESKKIFLIDFDGKIYDGTCVFRRFIKDFKDADENLLVEYLQNSGSKRCRRNYCQLCYPVKIIPDI